jgi:hypothetical protein
MLARATLIAKPTDQGTLVSTTVTISLPDDLYEQVENLAQHTHREVAELLTDTIAASLHGRDQPSPPLAIAELSDEELLALVDLQLPPDQDRRFSQLLDQQQAGELTPAERAELLAHLQMYQQGLLLKAQALNAAVRRGLRPPLEP